MRKTWLAFNKMKSIFLKKNVLSFLLLIFIFLLDRFSKIYIIETFQNENITEIYLTSFLNFYLIWNKGIAFGFLSFEQSTIYNLITLIIVIISLVILLMALQADKIKSYFLILVLGGSLGNLYDRLFNSAVPDFIDFHIKDFHWFIFNIADVFITIGVICLISAEIFFNKKQNYNNE
jgi:signal peptidase II